MGNIVRSKTGQMDALIVSFSDNMILLAGIYCYFLKDLVFHRK